MNNTRALLAASLARRHRAERRFRLYGVTAISFALVMLVYLLWSIAAPGISGFFRHEITLEVEALAPDASIDTAYLAMVKAVEGVGSSTKTAAERRQLLALVGSFAAFDLINETRGKTGKITVSLPLSDLADQTLKGRIDRHAPAHLRPISDRQLQWLDDWANEGRIHYRLNRDFFTRGDSRAPEAAGFMGSMIGSLWLVLVALLVALPVAVLAAIYLECFAPKNRFAMLLEVAINNLAAVPSIIYGLLGLAIFLQVFGLPRSSALVGGLTIAMLILPVIIIATRAALAAVPPSMREAAVALGASPLQAVFHHTVPYARPGILTGVILGTARAIGETAPLLMIGMVAFVADLPRTPLDPAAAMPVQIYLWASSPEAGFIEKTSTGILVLLGVLLVMNALAIHLRQRYELRWG
jgi:phosphate transport system permease protein